jgi:hypothetical protein
MELTSTEETLEPTSLLNTIILPDTLGLKAALLEP